MSTALNGYRLDSIIRYSGTANTRAARTQKRYQTTFAVTQPTASKHMNGCKHSPTAKLFVQLATSDYANGWSVISEGIAIVNQSQIRAVSTDELWARLRELDDVEHLAEASENADVLRAVSRPTPEALEAAAQSDIAEAEISLERAAIRRELAERTRRRC